MKMILAAVASLAAITAAGAAVAQSTPPPAEAEVPLSGEGAAFCYLPTAWSGTTGINGADRSQFSGNVWEIPETVFLDSVGKGGSSNFELGLRIVGRGGCNVSHDIRVTSANGGMLNPAAAPPGFVNFRRINYRAHWVNKPSYGVNFTPSPSSKASPDVRYDITNSNTPPPGPSTSTSAQFDIRLGVSQEPLAGPLIAGTYSDTVTVTLTIAN